MFVKRFMLIFPLFIIQALFVTGCDTNPPNKVPDNITHTGKVFVTSSVTGASIFVDGANSGKITPDTVVVSVGTRTIKLEKTGYISSTHSLNVIKDSIYVLSLEMNPVTDKVVLLEDFANVSCVPCVTSNRIIESLSHSYGKRLVIIKYPTNFPSPVDPFYLANPDDCTSRRVYYSVVTAPTVVVDGFLRPIPSDSSIIKDRLDAQLSNIPKFRIELSDSLNG